MEGIDKSLVLFGHVRGWSAGYKSPENGRGGGVGGRNTINLPSVIKMVIIIMVTWKLDRSLVAQQ